MFAYVKFLSDNTRLVVPVSNVKDFLIPSDISDFNGSDTAPVHEVFWPGDSKTCGGFYEAAVIYVGGM